MTLGGIVWCLLCREHYGHSQPFCTVRGFRMHLAYHVLYRRPVEERVHYCEHGVPYPRTPGFVVRYDVPGRRSLPSLPSYPTCPPPHSQEVSE